MNIQNFDALAAKLAGVIGAMVPMRFLQGSRTAKASMAATGAMLAYHGSSWLAQFLGIPEGLPGSLCGFLGMAIMARMWQAAGRAGRRHSSWRAPACGHPRGGGAYQAHGVPERDAAIWDAIENDDMLAAGLTRPLLWTNSHRLPTLGDADNAWSLNLRTWRPGKPHPQTWPTMYAQAIAALRGGNVGID